ncbi:bifunctional adenosylcobinamide kinase/adenosylcobinamide-phosphate guanylyltransferase [Microvirga sp. ACRRW]|uniref:bifunctional adenosylcobinamide kinase/adenosylcobinamide-phosphate guanylyltransferase n=1 Tax=Microvirga sp. ACRRW TaxID=2918205 RepID=UPI001EF60A21|nr:bifunctional adenosylcobinamide kinase/adenosylcobinamide-phosphate guanylyltransferase [Microvirga sp. ACRRW]MCG7394780.1 bifunctional adenosylcobinamide kinase/adenosylcobinamide-phosphate guanylyltransferase [Microvirga sp. ACRRW]
MPLHRRVLVLGGARSGKSRLAQEWAESAASTRVFIATAQAFDDEMRERIAHHQLVRDASWQTREAPLDLTEAILASAHPERIVLVDCLTLWLSNVMLAGRDVNGETDGLVDALSRIQGPVLLVSNEVGQGIVPATALGRSFRDEQGRLNQRIAQACDAVVLVTAGCPVLLKPSPPLNLQLG